MKAWLLLAAGCTSSAPTLAPIIDLPTNDSASAFPIVDSLDMAVAHQGAPVGDDLASKTFTHGQTVELGGVAFADDLVVHLTGLASGGEVAYGRTCSFAIAQGAPLPSPHLYFAREVKFGQLADVPEARAGGVAITYHDGSGLVVGGVDPQSTGTPVTDIERFDPRTGDLRYLATAAPRIGGVAAVLGTGSDSQIALIGGVDPTTGTGAELVELVEADAPAERRIDAVPNGYMGRTGLTATTLTDGPIIVMGGLDPTTNTPKNEVDEVTLTSGTAEVQQLHAVLAIPRSAHTATRLGDDLGASVLVAGGLDGAMPPQPIAQAELYKPLSEAFSTTFMYAMQVPRSGHQAVRMPDGSVLIIGGRDKNGAAVPILELFTQDAGFVKLMPPLPADAGLINFAATTLPDGRVLLTGGLDAAGNPTSSAFIARLDPINGSVEVGPTDKMVMPRAGHQATLLCDGTVLISGGTPTPIVIERYNPPALGRR